MLECTNVVGMVEEIAFAFIALSWYGIPNSHNTPCQLIIGMSCDDWESLGKKERTDWTPLAKRTTDPRSHPRPSMLTLTV